MPATNQLTTACPATYSVIFQNDLFGPKRALLSVQFEISWAPELGLSRCRSVVYPRTQGPANSDGVFWRYSKCRRSTRVRSHAAYASTSRLTRTKSSTPFSETMFFQF